MTRSRITGPSTAAGLDRREAAWREDLAELALAGQVAVPNYVSPAVWQVLPPSTPLLTADNPAATAASELLHGERFAVLDVAHGYAWGYGLHDHYVGHVALAALGPAPETADEARIGPGDALLFTEPKVKAPVAACLPMGAVIDAEPHDARFVRIRSGPHTGRFLHNRHVMGGGADWVELALHFLGSPYRWGGRTRAGVDCSGLIQIAMQLVGIPARRDSDMLIAGTAPVTGTPRRGDLAWWPGHIGVMLDAARLLHANAHWMATVIEPLADVVARAAAADGPAAPRFGRP